jgi:hypothetical protein
MKNWSICLLRLFCSNPKRIIMIRMRCEKNTPSTRKTPNLLKKSGVSLSKEKAKKVLIRAKEPQPIN